MVINAKDDTTYPNFEYVGTCQVVTAWTDFGSEIDVRGFNSFAIYADLDVNNATNVRLRILGKHTSAGTDEYSFPIQTIGATSVTVDPEYKEFNTDADQKLIFSWDLDNVVNFVKIQSSVQTAGATKAVITAYACKGKK